MYRAAERMAASLERYAKFTASDPVSDACTALALDIRALAKPGGAP